MNIDLTRVVQASVVLASAALLAACGPQVDQAAAQVPPPPLQVGVVVAQATTVPLVVELPGRTAPSLIAELRPQVSGIIKARAYTEGSEVEAGELLYEIEPATYKAAHDRARAGLARAEAQLNSARVTAKRLSGLAKRDVVSRQANDDADAALKLAEADVASALAALEQARIELEFTRLSSPIDGRIGRSEVTVGALVTANQTQALATVQQLDPIYVDLTRSSAELMSMRRDVESGRTQRNSDGVVPATLTLEDGSAYAQSGRLAFSEVTVDPGTGSVTLRAVFPNPRGELLPGMYVRARVEEGVRTDAILLPHAAVGRDLRGNAKVMVVSAEGVVESRLVEAERSIGDQWLITDGLADGEKVIVEGLQRARAGAVVITVDVTAGTAGE